MTDAQAFSTLAQIARANPEHKAAAEAVMAYISELRFTAEMAADTLTSAAIKLPMDRVIPHNAGVVARRMEELTERSPSHGNDI